ncbi:MAG: WD40/YVTN/BNR-like repeat-containing protein, partial [Candidatus Binatia bacterium]
MSKRMTFVVLALAATVAACHSKMEFIPLTSQTIYFSDKFYDVKATGPQKALIAGYGGKLLETTDGGLSFNRLPTGTDLALYEMAVVGDKIWVSGQEGQIIHSADAGKTWQKQDSGTKDYLFSIVFLDENHGFAVGDRSAITETFDGGKTWQARKIARSYDAENPDLALAMQDPIFYDIRFLDQQNGWIVGEFGRLLRTTDGGQNWTEHQDTLMTDETGIVDPMDIPTFFGVHLVSGQEAYAAGLDGKVAVTRDGGELWTFDPMELEFPIIDPLYEATITPGGTGWAVGAAGEVVTRKAGETAWKRADLGMAIYTWIRSIDFADAQNGWLVGGYG